MKKDLAQKIFEIVRDSVEDKHLKKYMDGLKISYSKNPNNQYLILVRNYFGHNLENNYKYFPVEKTNNELKLHPVIWVDADYLELLSSVILSYIEEGPFKDLIKKEYNTFRKEMKKEKISLTSLKEVFSKLTLNEIIFNYDPSENSFIIGNLLSKPYYLSELYREVYRIFKNIHNKRNKISKIQRKEGIMPIKISKSEYQNLENLADKLLNILDYPALNYYLNNLKQEENPLKYNRMVNEIYNFIELLKDKNLKWLEVYEFLGTIVRDYELDKDLKKWKLSLYSFLNPK